MSALHAAHLTMFYLNGYSYVFSKTGAFIADILHSYCARGMALSRAERVELTNEYHTSLKYMHAPLGGEITNDLRGTVEDRKFLCVFGENDEEYAWGIVVRFNTDLIVVFMPSAPDTQHLYRDQLEGKCSQLYVRFARLVGKGMRIDHVELASGDAIVMPIEST